MEDLTPLLTLIGNVGSWIVFLVLFLRKDAELKQARDAHMDDLRKMSGTEPLAKRNEVEATSSDVRV